MVNFQAWDSSQQELSLVEDIVNNIQGTNETGKSVLFKVMYEMYFPDYYGVDDLIRDGCQAGLLFITLTDGTQIIWECAKKYRRFYLQYPGEDIKEWLQPNVPQEITDALGFIVNYDHNIILNIIDTDTPMPFVKSSPKYNASLLKSVVEPDVIKRFYETCQEKILEIATAKSNFDKAASLAYAKYSALEYEDCFLLERKRSSLEELSKVLRPTTMHFNSAVDLYAVIKDKPQEIRDVCSIAEPYLVGSESINKVVSSCKQLCYVVQTKPVNTVENPDWLEPHLTAADSISNLAVASKQLLTVLEKAPVPVAQPSDITGYLDMEESILALSKSIKSIKSASRKHSLANQLVMATHKALRETEQALGMCPVCGRKFND